MNYNGDMEEDWVANNTLSEIIGKDDVNDMEKFIAADYFQWGWETAMSFSSRVEDTRTPEQRAKQELGLVVGDCER